MRVTEDVLAVPSGPQIFRRLSDARDRHFVPPRAVEHLHTFARTEAEGVGGVTFDDNLVVACGIGQSPCNDVDLVDFVAGYRWQSDDPADEFCRADRHR